MQDGKLSKLIPTSTHNLKRTLQARHLVMMAIGGVIGAGFFLGVGGAIKLAGPAVIIAYLIGGVIALLITFLLGEMAVALPVAASFQAYSSIAISPFVGFLTGWTYWLAFLLGPASEVIAAGTFLHLWFPGIPIWELCLIVAASLTAVNLISAHLFGEVEFWLSLIKVIAILAFIILGTMALGFSSNPNISLHNFFIYGGFAPHGFSGIISAMLLVIFSYGGIESLGTAVEETTEPQKIIPQVLKGSILRIFVLYILSITVLLAVLPWNQAGLSSSPFDDAFKILGGARFGKILENIINAVLITAALSCIDTGIFATSRMLFAMADQGYFPTFLTKLHRHRKVPINAILISSSILFIGVLASIYSVNAYVWIGSLSGFGFLFSWLIIAISQPRMRKIIMHNNPGALKWKAPFYPMSGYIACGLILAIFVGELFTADGQKILLAGCAWFIVASLYYYISRRI